MATSAGPTVAEHRECPHCDGSGHVGDGSPLCPECAGNGVIRDESGYVTWSEEPRDCLALAVHGRTRDGEE